MSARSWSSGKIFSLATLLRLTVVSLGVFNPLLAQTKPTALQVDPAKAIEIREVRLAPSQIANLKQRDFTTELQRVSIEAVNDSKDRPLGIEINRIDPMSAARMTGLMPGDIVLKVNDVETTSPLQALSIYESARDKDSCEVLILRRNHRILLKIASLEIKKTGDPRPLALTAQRLDEYAKHRGLQTNLSNRSGARDEGIYHAQLPHPSSPMTGFSIDGYASGPSATEYKQISLNCDTCERGPHSKPHASHREASPQQISMCTSEAVRLATLLFHARLLGPEQKQLRTPGSVARAPARGIESFRTAAQEIKCGAQSGIRYRIDFFVENN